MEKHLAREQEKKKRPWGAKEWKTQNLGPKPIINSMKQVV